MTYKHELSREQTEELSQSVETIGDFVQNSDVLKNDLIEKIHVMNRQIHSLGFRLSIFTTMMDSVNGVTSHLKSDVNNMASCLSFLHSDGSFEVEEWQSFLTASQCQSTRILLDSVECHRDAMEVLVTDLADSIELVTDILQEYDTNTEDLKLVLSDVENLLTDQ